MTYEPIAYTYEADYHCPDCAFERFGRDEHGTAPEDAEDSEGNPVAAVAPWDEWWEVSTGQADTLSCGTCRGEIATVDAVLPDDYIDEMVDGYVECAFWAGLDWSTEAETGNPQPLKDAASADDIAPEALESIRDDCTAFAEDQRNDLVGHVDASQAGHDFYLTRNHHGAGFWDRGLGDLGDRLTKAAHVYGESELYIGDDGKVYVQ